MTLRRDIIASARGQRRASSNADTSWGKLGRALHIIQDFYSHSNAVELGRSGETFFFGNTLMPKPPQDLYACPVDPNVLGPNGGGGLTSGYFLDFTGCMTVFLPPGKCFHGNYEQPLVGCRGINKDKPEYAGNDTAATAATAASKRFVESIVAELAGDDKALARLLGQFDMLFAIDTTGSMGDELNQIKAQVTDVVQRIQSNPSDIPSEWVLLPFNDPDIGPAFVTDNASEFLAALQNLQAMGGGDCAEPSQQTLFTAVTMALPTSKVLLFTDAAPNDAARAPGVNREAATRETSITPVITGSCSPVDPAYLDNARETGGQLLVMNADDLSGLADLLEPEMSGDLQTMARGRGTLSGTPRSVDVPVDGSVTRLVVSTELDLGLTARLYRPNGVQVTANDPDVKISVLAAASVGDISADDRPVYTVTAPQTGTWRVEVEGTGVYSNGFAVLARGNSPVEFATFEFVAKQDGPDGGYFPIPGMPLAGSAVGRATLSAGITPAFRMVDEGGATIQALTLTNEGPDAKPGLLHGYGSVA